MAIMQSAQVGAEIRRRRKAAKMTLEELAHRIDDTAGNLSRIERGTQGMRQERLQIVAQALACSVSDLYAAAEGKPEGTPDGFRAIVILEPEEFDCFDGVTPAGNRRTFIESSFSEFTFAAVITDIAIASDFPAGSLAVIDPREMPAPGDWVALRSERYQKTYIRKYRFIGETSDSKPHWQARPSNPDFPTLDSQSDGLKLLGVVIENRLRYRD